jgi:hypothetical protein
MVITNGILYKNDIAVGISYLHPIDILNNKPVNTTVVNKSDSNNTHTETATYRDVFQRTNSSHYNPIYKTVNRDPTLDSWRIKQPHTWRVNQPFKFYRNQQGFNNNSNMYKNQKISSIDNYHNDKFKRNFSMQNKMKPPFISNNPNTRSNSSL